MQHTASPGTVMRRRQLNDLFYRPRTHRNDELQLPKRQPVVDADAETLPGSPAHHRKRVSDLFYSPEPLQQRRLLPETGRLLRTPQQRMRELFYDQKSDATRAREPAADTKPRRQMRELFYRPPMLTQSESELCRGWPPSLTKWISLPLNDSAIRACEPESLIKSTSLPLNDSGLATTGTQNLLHSGGQSRMCQAEQKDSKERFERLNSLSAVIERKLQEEKERKTLRLICLLTSEAMQAVKMI